MSRQCVSGRPSSRVVPPRVIRLDYLSPPFTKSYFAALFANCKNIEIDVVHQSGSCPIEPDWLYEELVIDVAARIRSATFAHRTKPSGEVSGKPSRILVPRKSWIAELRCFGFWELSTPLEARTESTRAKFRSAHASKCRRNHRPSFYLNTHQCDASSIAPHCCSPIGRSSSKCHYLPESENDLQAWRPTLYWRLENACLGAQS